MAASTRETPTLTTESDPKPNPDHLLDWLDTNDSVSSFLSPFLDDPYSYSTTNGDYDTWWEHEHQDQDPIPLNQNPSPSLPIPTPINPSSLTDPSPESITRKRKQTQNPQSKPSNPKRSKNEPNEEKSPSNDEEKQTKKTTTTTNNNNSNNNSNTNKDSRWAEQLLNPCASAIDTGNVPRIQHLLFVLHDLSSVSGDANHRLAAYGLRALTHKLNQSNADPPVSSFASLDHRLFQRSLIKFHELTPWFTFIYNLANASMLETLNRADDARPNLHLLDIGVSHGVQWPTLMEAVAQRAAGPPPLFRLTIVGDSIGSPFAAGPPCDDFPARLLRFAKTINLNLQIKVVNQPLETLTRESLEIRDNETLVACSQFRLHQLSETARTGFLGFLKELEPELLVLSENDCDHRCYGDGFASVFGRRVDFLWRFLDSTSVGFKGRECEERRVIEGEAAMALLNEGERNEGHLQWKMRMREIGFSEEGFSHDVMESGRSFLRKYDSNWETRVDDGCVSLCWKGQPVTFCSVWKIK